MSNKSLPNPLALSVTPIIEDVSVAGAGGEEYASARLRIQRFGHGGAQF
jgi:hypothetical protein